MKSIGIIGCGNLGTSILNGISSSGVISNEKITITKRNLASIIKYRDNGITVTDNNREALERCDIIIIALKPYNILSTLSSLKSALNSNKHTIVSLATGITINEIEEQIGTGFEIYRAMPNTAADVKESMTCICTNSTQTEEGEVDEIFKSIGSTIRIEEPLMEAATVLGACGIAYVLRFIRSMVQGGIQIGFDAKTASKIVNQTVKGASQLLIENNNHPEFEIDKVTTPKGCTIAGLNEMEHNGFSSALIKGIVTSKDSI